MTDISDRCITYSDLRISETTQVFLRICVILNIHADKSMRSGISDDDPSLVNMISTSNGLPNTE